MMFRTLVLTLTTLNLFQTPAFTQQPDSVQVEQAVLTYIENFFENKFEEMNEVLHPQLSKRGVNPDRSINENLTPSKLKELLKNKQALPLTAQKNKVFNIKIFRDVATASLVTGYPRTRWVEFCHLVREQGKWKIINIFWEFMK